jgi:hypothetical protein
MIWVSIRDKVHFSFGLWLVLGLRYNFTRFGIRYSYGDRARPSINFIVMVRILVWLGFRLI